MRNLVAAIAVLPTLVGAQAPTRPASGPNASDVLKTIKWRSVGPANNAGRISVVTGVPGDPNIYYVAGANGGIIRTTNGGTTFQPLFDDQTSSSIGAIAVAPSDKHIVYVGTGEGNPRNNASVGDGMYKSVDGGDHWTKIGLEKSDKIARLVIDSKNPDIVFACVLGREWGPSEERGVFKTMDGGKAWKRVLYVDKQTSCSDLSAQSDNSNVLYAGMYTYQRWAWHLESGGGNTAVWKSVNGGETWERLSGPDKNHGLPKKAMDRIGVAVAPSNPDVVYVLSETLDEGEMWRSDDGGDHFRMTSRDPNINFRPFYYADLRVDPMNPNRVFTLSGSLYLTEDGGTTFRTVARDVHGDHQAMWIDPMDPKRILSGSDGGWQVSADGGRNWEVVNTFPFTQFYHINYDLQRPYMTCGGLQDNGNWCGPSMALSGQGNRKNDWYTVSGGDGFFTVPDISKPWLVYSDAQGGMISITDTRTGAQKQIYPYPNRVGSVGDAMASHKYRFNWNSPIALSRQNPSVVYFGGNVLFKSSDHGLSWTPISGDLTTNDPKKLVSSGGPIVVDNTAAEFHCTIISIAPSPLDSNVIWVSTDDGNVQVTRDGGKSWSNVFVNIAGVKPAAWLPTIDASSHDAGTAYVAVDHHQDDDYSPMAYMTTDFGKTWKPIMGDLPASAGWVHVVREDPRNRNLLYLGAEMGAWASWDKGAHWSSLRGDLPVVQVRDIQVHPRDNDILLATHGRGLFIMDDASALQQLADAASGSANATLFDIRTAVRWNMWSKDGNLGQKTWSGANPPQGAMITYYLKVEPRGAVDVTVSDAAGKVLRRMNRVSDLAGVNRITWDLRGDAPAGGGGGGGRGAGGGGAAGAAGGGQAQDTSLAALRDRRRAAQEAGESNPGGGEEGGGGGFGGGGAPMVPPGTYTIAMRVDGATLTKTVVVENDPRSDMTPAQITAQYDAAVKMQATAANVNRVIAGVDDILRQTASLRDQLRSARGPLTEGGASPQAVIAQIDSTQRELRHFRDSVLARPVQGLGYRQYPRLREEVQTVSGMVSRPFFPPTAGEMLRAGELGKEAVEAQARFDLIVATRVSKINTMLSGAQHVIVPRPAIVP